MNGLKLHFVNIRGSFLLKISYLPDRFKISEWSRFCHIKQLFLSLKIFFITLQHFRWFLGLPSSTTREHPSTLREPTD